MKNVTGILAFGCAACVAPASSTQIAAYDVVSVLSGFESGNIEHGHHVTVYGFLTFGDDKHNIWQSAEDYKYVLSSAPDLRNPVWHRCITIYNYGKFRKNLLKYDGKLVKITGNIIQQSLDEEQVNTGSCSEIGISLEGSGAHIEIR